VVLGDAALHELDRAARDVRPPRLDGRGGQEPDQDCVPKPNEE
jgi:hypothetical protein